MKKAFKRPAAAVILSAILLCASACSGGADNEENNVTDYFPSQTDAEFIGDYSIGMADAECELDYSNIICYTDKEEYSPDEEKITVTVENQNKGKGFYVCDIPNVERYSDGEWVRLNYYPAAHAIPERWAFCAIEGRSDINYSTNVSIWTDELEDEWTEDEYRAVIYVGREIIYAPFKIVSK